MKKSTPSGPHSTILIGLMLLLSSCQPLIPPTTIDPISPLAVEIVHSSTSRAGELVTWSGFVESTSYNTGMLLMNIFYDELELNFTKIKIVANRTMIWDARQTPMPLVNEQVIVPGVYVIFIGFLYPTSNLDFIHFARFKKCSATGERLNSADQEWMAKMQGDIPIIHLCYRHTPEPC